MDKLTEFAQELHDQMKATESENFHLKKQLTHKNREIKHLKRVIRSWKEKHDKLLETKKKPKYTNWM